MPLISVGDKVKIVIPAFSESKNPKTDKYSGEVIEVGKNLLGKRMATVKTTSGDVVEVALSFVKREVPSLDLDEEVDLDDYDLILADLDRVGRRIVVLSLETGDIFQSNSLKSVVRSLDNAQQKVQSLREAELRKNPS